MFNVLKDHRLPRRSLGIAAALIAVAGTVAAQVRPAGVARRMQSQRVVTIGGLLPLTGEGASAGQLSRAAMELAVEDVNLYAAHNPGGLRFAVQVQDTKMSPAVALEGAKALRKIGARLVIGPTTSAEVALLAPFVNGAGMLVVSPSSTAGTLAIAGDNVFRLSPSDSLEAIAISTMMWQEGVRTIVPLWRDDPGSADLVTATRRRFTALGGSVLKGVHFAAQSPDFGAALTTLHNDVQLAREQQGRGKVAVFLATVSQTGALFARAATDPVIADVPWYGNDGATLQPDVVGDRDAAEFAMRVGFPSPVFALEEGSRTVWEPVIQRIHDRAKMPAMQGSDAYSLAVYDAVWIAAKTYLATGATPSPRDFQQTFAAAAGMHYGPSGWTMLNAAGDRAFANFDFWAVRAVNGVPRWSRVAWFDTRTGQLVRVQPRAISSLE